MVAQGQPPVIQAQISSTPSFQDVIDQNPDGWAKETPEFKNNLAESFFAKHVAGSPGFANEAPETQADIKTQFNKKYNVGQVAPTNDLLGNIHKGLATANLYAGAVADPAIKAMTMGAVDSGQTNMQAAQKQYPGIATDPGALGDAYRAHQNPYANMAGSALGAAGGVSNLAKSVVGKFAIPAYSAVSHGVNVARGEETPLQALLQTGVDTATGFLPGGKTLIGNAAKQGLGGAVGGAASSAANDFATGQQFDPQRASKEALMQAILGAGMGAGMHLTGGKPAMAQEPKSKYRQYGPADKLYKGSLQERNQRFIDTSATQIIKLHNQEMHSEATKAFNALPEQVKPHVKAQVDAFNTKNEGRKQIKAQVIKQAAEQLGPNPASQKAVQQLKAAILERHHISPEQRSAHVQKQRIELDNIKTQNKEKPVQAKIHLEKAKQETLQARTIREQARLEYQRAQQLLNVVKKGGDAKALTNAKKLITSAQEKLTQANNDLKAKTTHEKAQTEQAKQTSPQKPPTVEPQKGTETQAQEKVIKAQVKITGAGRNQKTIEQAIREGKAIEAIHHADKAGTRDDSTFEHKFDKPYETGTIKRLVDPATKRVITNPSTGKPIDGKTKAAQAMLDSGKAELRDVPIVRTVNENGKFSMRYLEDIKGAVKISQKEHPYAVVMDENGKPQAVRNGEVVAQTADNLTRHSELKARLEKIDALAEKLKAGETVKVSDIPALIKDVSEKDFSDKMKDVPQETIDKLAKDAGCC